MRVVQVLVDADNVEAARLRLLLRALATTADDVPRHVVVAGRPSALAEVAWPDDAVVLPEVGWQRADVALMAAYEPGPDPLVLVTGDGDFGLLASRHAGPVLVVSGSASSRLAAAGRVVDPALEGDAPVADWLRGASAG